MTESSGSTVSAASGERVGWRVLGEVTVELDGVSGSLVGQRQRAVLAYLVLHAGENVSVDQLIDGLWAGEPPMTARNSIQRFVADIRRRLGPTAARLVTTTEGYRLVAGPDEVDALRSRRHLHAGLERMQAGDAAGADREFRLGLAEWRGRSLAGIGDVAFRDNAITQLEELRTQLLEASFEARLELGRHDSTVAELRRFASDHPHRERAWWLLLVALYRCGRQTEALDAARLLRRTLLDDLGVDPSPEITELVHDILMHAPWLRLRSDAPDPLATPEPGSDPTSLDAGHGRPATGVMPSPLLRSITGPIAGRSSELERARRTIDELVDGLPRVTFVSGEPGIGKTRLMAEMAALAQQCHATVVYGRAAEDAARPLGAWTEALDELLDDTNPVRLVSHHDDARGHARHDGRHDGHDHLRDDVRDERRVDVRERARRVLDPLRTIDTTATDDDPGSLSEERRATLFRTVVELLNDGERDVPLVVVLDDLQWADAATLQLVRHVARNLERPVWLIASFRNTGLVDRHPLVDVVGSLRGERHVDVHQLDGLDEHDLVGLLGALLPDVDSDRLVGIADTIRRETNGNPFFAGEIVRDLIESSNGRTDDALATLGGDGAPLPDSVRQVVRQRVARLGESAAATLRMASVLGREFHLRDLADVVRHDEHRVLDDLEAALDAALVSEAPGRPDRFSFSHDLVQHALYHDLSRSRRRRLHARAGLAILARTQVDAGPSRHVEAARHLLDARDPAIATETIETMRCAADVAAGHSAPDEAASLLASAIELAGDPDFAAHLDRADRLRVEMMVERGVHLRSAGDAGYREVLLDAGRAAHAIGDVDSEVRAAMANTRGVQTNIWELDHDRIAQLRSALSVLGDERSERHANLLAGLASEQWDDAHRAESAVRRAESIAMARIVGDRSTLANVLARAGRARNTITPPDELRRLVDEVRQLREHLDSFDPYLAVNVLRTEQNQALRDADPDLLHDASAALRELADRRPLAVCERSTRLTDVLLAGISGDGEEYLRLAEIAYRISTEMGDPESMIAYQGHLFYGLHLVGRTHELIEPTRLAAEERPHVDLYRAVEANVASIIGDSERARHIVDTGFSHGITRPTDDYTIQSLQLWADAVAQVEHLEASAELFELLAPLSGRLAGHVVHVTQPLDLSIGRLCRTLGRYDEALRHLDISAEIASRFGATWMSEQTDLARALTLQRRGLPGDDDRADAILVDVIDRATHNAHPAVAAEATAAR